jgi:hypothetical protein
MQEHTKIAANRGQVFVNVLSSVGFLNSAAFEGYCRIFFNKGYRRMLPFLGRVTTQPRPPNVLSIFSGLE